MHKRSITQIATLVSILLLSACGVPDTGSPAAAYPPPRSRTNVSIVTEIVPSAVPAATSIAAYPPPVPSPPAVGQSPQPYEAIDYALLNTQVALVSQRIPLNRDDAIVLATATARLSGLYKAQPDNVVARQMILEEYDALIGLTSGPSAAKYGRDPKQLVWVVTIFGAGRLTGPGQVGTDEDLFEYLTVVLSVETGRVLGTGGPPMPTDGSQPQPFLPTAEPTAVPHGNNNPVQATP